MAVGIWDMSEDERQQIKYLSKHQIASAMYYNLCMGYNQADTASQVEVFGDSGRQQTVSLIMRAYGFSNRNAGRFRKIGAEYDDVLAYVNKYPGGYRGFREGPDEMLEFLKERVAIRNNRAKTNMQGNAPSNYQFTNNYSSKFQNNGFDEKYSSSAGNDTGSNAGSVVGLKLGIAILAAIVAGIIFVIRYIKQVISIINWSKVITVLIVIAVILFCIRFIRFKKTNPLAYVHAVIWCLVGFMAAGSGKGNALLELALGVCIG